MLSANCCAVGEELLRRLSASTARRLSPIGSAVLTRLHALQAAAVRAHGTAPPREAAREEEGLELSCESADWLSDLSSSLSSCDCASFHWSTGELSAAEVSAAAECVHRLAVAADSVWLESVVMQVEFETLYALSTHCRDIDRQRSELSAQRRVDELLAIDTRSAQSASQPSVVSFYSTLFQLCLHSPALSAEARSDRSVQREVAAAVESVFPLSHLREHASRDASERRRELSGVAELVLGIRLFNQQIGKGGARLQLSAPQLMQSLAAHNSALEQESVFIGEIANTYTSLLAHYHATHGPAQSRQRAQEEQKQQLSASASVSRTGSAAASLTPFPSCLLDAGRVHSELIHRRQYLLFLQALQSEGGASVAAVQSVAQQLDDAFSQLTSIVGLRAAVPKHTVFPAFERVGRLYRQLLDEADKLELRQRLLAQLQDSRNPFITSLTTQHIRQCKELQSNTAQHRPSSGAREADFDAFVTTVSDQTAAAAAAEAGSNGDTAPLASSDVLSERRSAAGVDGAAGDECVRVSADSSASFMSVALAYQGYCCVTLVRHSGFLVPGDAALGVIRYRHAHFAFATVAAMRAFVQQPQHFIGRVQAEVAVAYPPLIHLLCLQSCVPHTDIALYITDAVVQAAHKHSSGGGSGRESGAGSGVSQRGGASAYFPPLRQPQQAAATQTPTHFPDGGGEAAKSEAGGLQSLHWNEWEMRRRAIQLADLRSKATSCTQTDKSHFRRDNGSQYTLPSRAEDGSVAAVGSQTRVDKSTNSERTVQYMAGLRTQPQQHSHITNIALRMAPLVGEPTNPPLNSLTAPAR